MPTTLQNTPAIEFQPLYLFENELALFGLPTVAQNAQILSTVAAASSMCDSYCMKQDSDGYGSLVYSTYTERVNIRRGQGNVFRLSKRPMVGVDAGTIAALQVSGANTDDQIFNCYDNGALAALGARLNGDGDLCSIIAISGRYGATRRGDPTPDYMLSYNPLIASQLFGSAPSWYPLDPLQCDYNPKNSQVWAPPGVYLYTFTDVQVTYTAGFNPLRMPRNIKQATANITKNLLAKPIPGIVSANFTDAALVLQYTSSYIDTFTAALLEPYINRVYA